MHFYINRVNPFTRIVFIRSIRVEMKKIKLEIAGLSYSKTQSGAYALVLEESNGSRKLPIIIGGPEAQSIAIHLENMTPTRPLTHDLFKSFAHIYQINIKEVVIYNLSEGIFYSKLVCDQDGKELEIDARTSDAIAIGLRCNSTIYIYESILDNAGVQMDENPNASTSLEEDERAAEFSKNPLQSISDAELEAKLNEALANEDYEFASQIRDELNRRQE